MVTLLSVLCYIQQRGKSELKVFPQISVTKTEGSCKQLIAVVKVEGLEGLYSRIQKPPSGVCDDPTALETPDAQLVKRSAMLPKSSSTPAPLKDRTYNGKRKRISFLRNWKFIWETD